jgi:8-oxo-(d)GTP phosphatase
VNSARKPAKPAKPAKPITAAGGVVWRMRDGAPEILVVHRPGYDDWTLPKGKPMPDEPRLLAAVREVAEETGARVAVQQRVCTVTYWVDDVRKKVNYWSMRYLGGEFAPNDEVDEIAWLRVGRAHARMSYPADRAVLEDFDASPVADSVIVLLRHAKAGKRADWNGDDDQRPLDEHGTEQARALVALLENFAPTRIYAADRTRCVQTVQPLADRLDLDVRVEPAFSDEAYDGGAGGTATTLLALAKPGQVSVVCSQGYTIPSLIDRLGAGIRSSDTKKGAWWVLTVVDGDVIATDPYDAP